MLRAAATRIKIYAVSCGCCPFIYAIVIAAIYWSWLRKARDYDDQAPDLPGDTSLFDMCGGLANVKTNSDGSLSASFVDTKWKVILQFNAFFFCIHLCFTGFVMAGVLDFLWCCCIAGGFCHCLSNCIHLACIITTGVYRFSADGERCAESNTVFAEDGSNFKEVGEAIKNLFIA